MKFNEAKIKTFIKKPDDNIRVLLFYGFDRGLIREHLENVRKAVIPEDDEFSRVDIDSDKLKSEPSLLYEEASAISFFGGRRVIVISNCDNSLNKLFKEFMDELPGDAIILLEGSDSLKSNSSLVKLLEKSSSGAVVPCYYDEDKALKTVIKEGLSPYDLTIDNDALSFMVDSLGADRMQTRSELEKLSVYMGKEKNIALADVQASLGDSSAQNMFDLAFLVAEGKHLEINSLLERLYNEGLASVAMLRVLISHFQKILQVKGQVKAGTPQQQAINSVKPPINFKYKGRFGTLVSVWSEEMLFRALEMLTEAEIKTKTSDMPEREICVRAIMQVAWFGSKAMRRN